MPSSTEPITLQDGALYALSAPYALDGRVTSHPVSTRGFAPSTIYLVVEPGHALLIDTGLSIHEKVLIEMLDGLLEPGATLSIWMLRIGEFASIANVRPFAERFDVTKLYGTQGNPPVWADFRPEYVPYGTEVAGGVLSEVEGAVVRNGDVLEVGTQGRTLLAARGAFRLLPWNWVYDDRTKTLFTADAFTWVWRETEEGPWVTTEDEDPPTLDELSAYLLGTRFWWLAGARTDTVHEDIAAIFEANDVETIAPSFGCIIRGKKAVERHLETLYAVLDRMPGLDPIGLEVGSWRAGASR